MTRVRLLRGGQVTLPAAARRKLKLAEGDYLEAELVDNGVLLKPISDEREKTWQRVLDAPKSVRYIGPEPRSRPDQEEEMIFEAVEASRHELIRAVLDSSVLISAFLTAGGTSHARRYYAYSDENVEADIADLAALAEAVTDLPELRAVPLDQKDDVIVATAAKAGADFLVTGDHHLLSLGAYGGHPDGDAAAVPRPAGRLRPRLADGVNPVSPADQLLARSVRWGSSSARSAATASSLSHSAGPSTRPTSWPSGSSTRVVGRPKAPSARLAAELGSR